MRCYGSEILSEPREAIRLSGFKFRGPDEVVYRYLELMQRLGSARGQNPVAGSGYVFAFSCAKCGNRERIERIERDKEGRTVRAAWLCGQEKCGEPWPVEVGFVLKHEIDGSPHGSLDELLAELATLSKWIGQLGHWERRIYVELYLCQKVGCYQDVARVAKKRFRSKRSWTEDRVRKIVTRAREVLSYRIFRAGVQAQ